MHRNHCVSQKAFLKLFLWKKVVFFLKTVKDTYCVGKIFHFTNGKNWSELKSHNVEAHCCLSTSKTKQNWWCLAHSITFKFKNTNTFTHILNLHVHKHQKSNLETEPNPAKLKKESKHFILKQGQRKRNKYIWSSVKRQWTSLII